MAKKTKPATVPITKISIENVSKRSAAGAVELVCDLIKNRLFQDMLTMHDIGKTTFSFASGVSVTYQRNPADTLYFYIHDREGEE